MKDVELKDLKIGSLVALKSGGPIMSVTTLDRVLTEDPIQVTVGCAWICDDGTPQEIEYPAACLRLQREAA